MRIGIVRGVVSSDRDLGGLTVAQVALVTTCSVVLSILALTQPARAQTDDERARAHFEAGRAYYDQARYDDAVREFEQAYALSQRPELLLNTSQAHERALRYDQAIASAERYLSVVPDAPDRRTIEERIANLRVLEQRYEQAPPEPLPAPGSSPTAAAAPPAATAAAATLAQPSAATSAPEAPSASPTPTPAERASTLTVPAIVLMSVGGASLVASLVTGLVAHGHYTSLERQCDADGLCPAEARDELDEGETLATASTVLAILGVLSAGAGGALLYVGARRAADTSPQAETSARRLAIGPGPTPLSLQGTLKF